MTGLCIYHGGCTDGVAAAWAVWKKHQDYDFYAGVYQQEPPMDKIKLAKEVIVVDFSYKRDVMQKICALSQNVTVLDHHKTARDDLMQLFDDGSIQAGIFDMDRCGAMLAWDYYHGCERPKVLEEIDKQDRWLPNRDAELIMSLRSHDHWPIDETKEAWKQLMHEWSGFMTDGGYDRLKSDGKAIYRYYRQRVDETKRHSAPMRIGEYVGVPVVNAPYYLASDVAGELAQESESGIGAVWWRNSGGSVTFSLRSRGEVDVSKIALGYGGGGHPGASGFRVDSLTDVLNMDYD